MRVLIIGNGNIANTKIIQNILKPNDIILCCDGGSKYLFEEGIIPHYIIGDLDSSIPQIIQSHLFIEHIPPIPERVQLGQRFICSCQGSHDHGLAPRIVTIFYHKVSGAVKDSYNVSLKTMDIAV